MGVAVRTYYRSPRHDDDWLESWLELWGQADNGNDNLLPGYGWIFGVGDGTSNVGLGILNTSSAFGNTDYRALLQRWLDSTPEEWGYREENRTAPIRGAALPMGFNRTPHYTRGVAPCGRCRRHGQSLQRRGHRLRDGVRKARRRRDRPGVSHETPRRCETALQAYPERLEAGVRRLLHPRPESS